MRERKYCLPHETRELVKQENIDDLSLKLGVSEIIKKRFQSFCNADEEHLSDRIVGYCHKTLERLFEKQGLEMARFITNEDDEDDDLYSNISDITAEILDQEEFDEMMQEAQEAVNTRQEANNEFMQAMVANQSTS